MKKLMALLLTLIALVALYFLNNTWLQVTHYTVPLKKLPKEMNGLKVVQISDLHDAQFGENHQKLIAKVKEQKPDIIVITGDLIDSNNYKLARSLQAVKGFVKIAPTYFVDGNHEISTNLMQDIHASLETLGVHVLTNEAVDYNYGGQTISIVGITDPLAGETNDVMLTKALEHVPQDRFTLLLAHRSEYAAAYNKHHIDLAYTGHAHGGQIRIPGIGGMIDHQWNFFPDYLEGVIKTGNMQQVISRGLGNSLFPARIFNRPEIVVTTLEQEESS